MPGREAYEKLKYEKLEEAIVQAIQSMEPARVGFSSEDEPTEVRNRPLVPSTRNHASQPTG
jgi:hypothetical protein